MGFFAAKPKEDVIDKLKKEFDADCKIKLNTL